MDDTQWKPNKKDYQPVYMYIRILCILEYYKLQITRLILEDYKLLDLILK